MFLKKLGTIGENLAIRNFRRRGGVLIARNFYTRYGEIDLVFLLKGALYFVEVKTRSNTKYGRPEESVTIGKIERFEAATQIFLEKYHWEGPIYLKVCCVFLANRSQKITFIDFY